MKNKVITAFLVVVLGANLVGNIYQYIRMENATKEVAVLTEQRDSLKERWESKEQQRDEQLSQLEDLQTTLSELEKEKATKSEILAQKQAEEKANEETEDEPETEAKEQTGKSSNKNMSDTSSQPTEKAEATIQPEKPPEDLTGGDTDGDGFMSEEEAAAIDWGDWSGNLDLGEPGEYNPNVTIFAP